MKCGILEITHIVWMIIFCVVHKYWTKIFLKFNLLWKNVQRGSTYPRPFFRPQFVGYDFQKLTK